jgi:serpin B
MNTGEAEPTLVANGDDVQAVQLPYTGGRFAALALMPTKQSLTDYVHRLTPASLDTITGQLRAQSIPVRIPKFTISQYTRLNDTLKAMGMPTAFSPTADLSPLSPVGGSVQSVVQRDFLKVDEHGTEAAAVTGISVIPQSTRSVAAFDHPFLFLVRDTTSGAIVFSAQIQDPAA